MILKLQKAGSINILNNKSLGRNNYLLWLKLSPTQKLKRRIGIAKTLFNQSNSPIYNALKAIFGGFDPENPDLITGEPSILPSRGINPKTVLNVAKGVRTLEDYLKTTKVSAPKLEGSSILRNNYATDRFLGGQMFESSLPEEAMKVQGHGMAKSSTILDALARLRYILDNGFEKGKTFYTAPLKLSEEGKQFGAYLGTAGGTPYFDGHFLITGKPDLMINSVDDIGTIYINDAYQNEEALKAALKIKTYLQLTYPNKTFKLYSEGFKNGGTIKTANARKWKHKEGGIIKASDGTKTSWISNSLGKVGNVLNSDWSKLAFNGISSMFGGGNSEPSYNVLNNYSDTMTNTAMQYILQLLQQALALNDLDSTLKSLYDPLNPHSIDGDIVGKRYKWIASQLTLLLKDLQKQLKELIDALNKLQKTNYITNALTNALLTGFDLALNYKPTTKKGSSVS